MLYVPKYPQAKLYPSEVVTFALLHAIKFGVSRTFYRWLTCHYLPLFLHVPECTRFSRLFKTHTAWMTLFLAAPTVLRVAYTYGIQLIHPMRESRSPAHVGKNCLSHHRCIVRVMLFVVLIQWGLICACYCAYCVCLSHCIFTRLLRNLTSISLSLPIRFFMPIPFTPPT